MKLAILETGRPPGDLAARFGDYPEMFERMLGEGFEIERYDVTAGQLPEPGAHEAFLITGSPAGVYEDHAWIAPLAQFIRGAGDSRMVGICFGHQIMAEALGGRVEKSVRGWGIGLQRYRIVRHEPWMGPIEEVAVPASHQDQVVVQPPNTEVIVESSLAPYAGLAWTDRAAISFQFHPEFAPEFAKALIAERRDRLPSPDAASETLDAPNDSERVAEWIRRFLKSDQPSGVQA